MNNTDLIFIGIKGSVIALSRDTGEQVWVAPLKGSDFVNVVLRDGVIVATCYGEVFCLDPITGQRRWHNPLKGYGTGLATIASETDSGGASTLALAEKRRRDQEAAASAAAAAASS